MQVTKRDGRIMEFNKERIVNAIVKAMMQTSGGVDIDLANKIAVSIEKGLENKEQATVYEIQDLVEKKLMSSSRKEVATAYITYRYNRDVARKSKTREVFLDIISAKTKMNSNKSIDSIENTPSIIMEKFAEEVAKPYVDNFLLTKDAREAEREGYIFINNKEYYLTKSLNSFQLSLANINNDEFENIESITNFLYTAINELKDEIDGNISIPNFDLDLSPFVRKTLFEELEKVGEDLNVDIKNLKKQKILDYLENRFNNLPQEKRIIQIAINRVIKRVHCSLKNFIENITSLNKQRRKNFCSIGLGTDISAEGRCIIREFIKIIQDDECDKENLPNMIWKKKKGLNYLSNDINFDLYNLVLDLTNDVASIIYLNLDSPINLNKGEVLGKGVISSIEINLPKIAIESFLFIKQELNLEIENFKDASEKFKTKLKKKFMNELEKYIKIGLFQLIERFNFQSSATKSHFPRLMSGLWMKSDSLEVNEIIEEVIRCGTLDVGLVGLAECLIVLTGSHQGESDSAMKFGLEIVNEINELLNEFSEKYALNFTLSGKEDTKGKFSEKDKISYGIIASILEAENYTAGSDIPKYYECTVEHKVEIESKFHKLFKGDNKYKITKEKCLEAHEVNEFIDLMDRHNLGGICFK